MIGRDGKDDPVRLRPDTTHTYNLCRTLGDGTRDLTYRALVSATGAALSRAGFEQVPQLEGPARLLADPVFRPLPLPKIAGFDMVHG